MSKHYNNLTPAEHERLSLLFEECSEVIQVVGKIMRHGYREGHPDSLVTNREDLEKEIGHVISSVARLCEAGDISQEPIHISADKKLRDVIPYLHHYE